MKPNRSLRRGLRLLLSAAALLAATPLLAAPPRFWMPLQSVGWQGQMLQPLADGQILNTEYANGIKVDLNDFSASVPNGNGRLFVSLSQNAAFSGDACLKPNGAGCAGGTLFLGFEVHSATPAVGGEVGTVTVYLDSKRQQTLDNQSCKDGAIPTRKPAADDRKIVLAYSSAPLQGSPTLTVREYKGNCTGWVEITPPGLDPALEAWTVAAAARETLGVGSVPSFLHFELAITAQPRGLPPLMSPIANDRLFGLGVKHSAGSFSALSFGAFPSLFAKPPLDLDTKTWATLDLHDPERIDLSMTAYNVGQLQITDDGGQGEAKDFADLTFRNDFICLTEEMISSERDETVAEINDLRTGAGLEPMTAVYPGDGEAPNNVLLVAGPIFDADFVLYGDLPGVTAYCAQEMGPLDFGECSGDGAGYKGITWARVGIKKSTAAPKGGKGINWFSDQFVDVFCTHTQADYLGDGEFANDQPCEDTPLSSAITKDCDKSPSAPLANPWTVNIREEQWRAFKTWAHQKRAGGNGSPNGLDRPAFVLGDLNQIAPKNVTATQPNQDIDDWIAETSGQTGFGGAYAKMRTLLGTLPISEFDQANGWAWDLYDLLARNENGTWIGNGTESAIPDTQADDCITTGQPSGYNTLDQLPKEARVDYILVLPAESGFPFYSLTGPSEQPEEPILDISANAGNWVDGLGCASDHAQVSARFGLVQTSVSANYNPNKAHRVTYRVSHLWDFRDADDGATDWYVKFGDFETRRLDAANNMLDQLFKGYTDDETLDGIAVPVEWSDALNLSAAEKFRAGVYVRDHDTGANDLYDSTGFGGSGFRGPHFEFDHAYPGTFRLIGNNNDPPGTGVLIGTADPSGADPDGSCALGCLGIETEGDGDEPGYDARVTQNVLVEEIP